MAFRWSASRILRYLKCPYSYYLRYKEKLVVPIPWQIFFGKTIHKAIEVCHLGNPHQGFKPTPERPLFFQSAKKFGGFWLNLWEREVEKASKEPGILWRNRNQYDILKGYGWALLAGTKDARYKGYYNSITHFPLPIKILEVEKKIRGSLWGFPFVGIIDQLWETEKGTAVVDLTTSRSNRTKQLQLTAYRYLMEDLCQRDLVARNTFGEAPVHYFVWMLGGEKIASISPHGSRELKEILRYVAEGVQFGKFPRTHQDYTCSSCEYRKACGKTGETTFSTRGSKEVEISLPSPARPPKPKQLYFKKGAKGGWFRGNQVKGKR